MKQNLLQKFDWHLWHRIPRYCTRLRHPRIHGQTDMILKYMSISQKKAMKLLDQSKPVEEKKRNILIVIPFRDRWDLTSQCLDSLMKQDFGGHRILTALVDNNSEESATQEGIEKFLSLSTPGIQFRHLRYDIPFNFSILNNRAIQDCSDFTPDLIFFVNNDVKFTDSASVRSFARFFDQVENPGAVGCTLLFGDGTIQHLFVSVGSRIVAAHLFRMKSFNPEEKWYQSPRPVSAVTGAALMVSAPAFAEVGGFDENLPSDYQDVDLCLKLQQHGRVNWTLPGISLIHYESQTREAIHTRKFIEYMYNKWGKTIDRNPFVSSRISRWSLEIHITPWPRKFPWRRVV